MSAAVLSPSSSGLSTPSDTQYTIPLEALTMEKSITPLQPQSYLTAKMASILRDLKYDTKSINTLITRADSNTIEATNISTEDFTGNSATIGSFLDTTLLNPTKLRERSIYLNSNEPVLLLGFPSSSDFEIQQIRNLKETVLTVLRERGTKPVRVYVRETTGEDDGLSFSLLNVVNSDIGVNMVGLLDEAFYGAGWKEELVVKEGYNGFDLIWRDEVWTGEKGEEEVVEVQSVREVEEEMMEIPTADTTTVAGATAEDDSDADAEVASVEDEVVEQEPIASGVAGAELEPMPSVPVRTASYKSPEDAPEDTDEEESESVQHPALRELLEREAQRAPVQYPTWSRNHDSEAYLDIIKTHSRGQEDSEPISVIARSEEDKEEFEVVDKP